MILRLEGRRCVAVPSTGVPELDGIHAFWRALRDDAPLPDAERLFVSDLVEHLPHVLLAYRHGHGFRIEFAGEVVHRLLGEDPTGACPTRRDPDPVHAAFARGFDTVDRLAVAGSARIVTGLSVVATIYLPFVSHRRRVAGSGTARAAGCLPEVSLVLTAMAGYRPEPPENVILLDAARPVARR